MAIGTEVWITIAISAVVAVAIAIIVYIMASKAGYEKRKGEAEAAIGGAENEAKRIVEDSKKAAESKKREILLEARKKRISSGWSLTRKVKGTAQKISRRRREEFSKKGRKPRQKTDAIEAKEEKLTKKMKDLESKEEELQSSRRRKLKRSNGCPPDGGGSEAVLVKGFGEPDPARGRDVVKEVEQQTKDEAEKRAKNIVASAIQRVAADHAAETTVSVVPLPNDEMKGRIIGP